MREKKEINIHIGERIRIARERCGLTQDQFSELVSLGTKNISDIERGVAGISISTLKRICERLDISSDTIVFGDQEKNDVEFITERLERLPPKQFHALLKFFNRLLELYGWLDETERR